MSLFPAYQSGSDTPNGSCPKEPGSSALDVASGKSYETDKQGWIRNESYKIQPANLQHNPSEDVTKNRSVRQDAFSSSESFDSTSQAESDITSSSSIGRDDRKINTFKTNNHRKTKKDFTRKRDSSGSRSSSRSRNKRKRKYSGSRSESGSPSYLRKSRHRNKKKHKYKGHKKKHKKEIGKRFQIPKFAPYKTFLEDFNIKHEDDLRYAEDRYGDEQFSTSNTLPGRKTAIYRNRWKKDYNILGPYNQKNPKKRKLASRTLRFFNKEYMNRFAYCAPENVLNLTSNLDSKRNPDTYILHKDKIQFANDSKDVKDVLEDGELLYNENDIEEEFSSVAVTIELNEIHTKTREFNARLRETPHDVNLWLDYVAFQDIALGNSDFISKKQDGGENDKRKDKKAESARNVLLRNKAVIEKKLSILKTASEQNPKSILLAVERLKLSKEIYDNETLDRQWKELIYMFPDKIAVWKHYLSFVGSHFTTFSVTKMARSYKNFFLKLKLMYGEGSKNFLQSSSPNDEQISTLQIEDEMVKLLLRLSNFWVRAGYREKSIALFQALIELNLYSPDFPGSYSLEDRLALFEPFWESGYPRFGESNSLGWATIAKNKLRSNNLEEFEITECYYNPHNNETEDKLIQDYFVSKTNEQILVQDIGEKESDTENEGKCGEPRLWLMLELERERKHWCPWRSREEEAEDPDRSVGFEDIQDYLFQFPSPSFTANSRPLFNLTLGFLRNLGVEMLESDLEVFGILSTHTFIVQMEVNSPENIGIDDKSLCGDIMQKVSADMLCDVTLETFTRNVFSSLSKIMEEPYKTQIILLWLRFEKSLAEASFKKFSDVDRLKSEKKSRIKFIKNEVKAILDQDRENSEIYCAFASCICSLEGYKNSWKILKMLLETRSKTSNLLQNPKVLLKIYTYAVINELHELKCLSLKKSSTGEPNLDQHEIEAHSYNARWLLTLAAENAAYKNRDNLGQREQLDMAEKSMQKNSDWIHTQLAANLNILIYGPNGGNDNLQISPVTYYNEFTARVFAQVWLMYFQARDTKDSDRFIEFVIIKLQQKVTLHIDPLHCIIEILNKIRIDLLLFDGSLTSSQKSKNALTAAFSNFPCNEYFLKVGILSNRINIHANVSDSTWRSITTSLVAKKTPCQSYVISILVRYLLNKFLNRDNREANMSFDLNVVTKSEATSIGHLNQAHKLLNQFIQDKRSEEISSPVIWRLLLWITRVRHEINPIKYPLSNVKTIFYRACQDNPGAKVFFLDVMNYCESATKTDIIDMKGKYMRKKYRNTAKAVKETQAELQHLMTEKEIHVRIPMEEVQVMLEPEDTY